MRWLWVIFLVVTLPGCFTSGKRGGDSPMVVYDLGLGVNPAASQNIQAFEHLALEVKAPLWFDSLGITYRLNYDDPSRLRQYAQARWVGAPALLIQQNLTQSLGLKFAGQTKAKCVLRIEITEFSQIFESRINSSGVLQGRAIWLDRSRQNLAELKLDVRVDAPTENSRGGVTALQQTVANLAGALQHWEAKLRAEGQTPSCAN